MHVSAHLSYAKFNVGLTKDAILNEIVGNAKQVEPMIITN